MTPKPEMTAKASPTDELTKRVRRVKQNSLLYWYPKIEGKVPTPKTFALTLPENWQEWLDKGADPKFVKKLADSSPFGYPVFMRTDQMAGKHSWNRTCFVPDRESLAPHICYLLEENAMSDWMGETAPRAIVLREFLKLKTYFTESAYQGMPVAREFRFFATNGRVDCCHPYWPHQALEQGRPSDANWKSMLATLDVPTPDELTGMTWIAQEASRQFSFQVSADICKTEDGKFYLTDMATGIDSFHWKHGSTDGGGNEGEEI